MWLLRFLAAERVISFSGIVFEVLFAAAFAIGGPSPEHQEKISMVTSNAVVTAHGEPEKEEPEEIPALPARWVNVDGVAETAFH